MTPPIDDPAALRRVLSDIDILLLDFDGPICSVFAGLPASVVADQLRGVLAEGGYTDLPDDIRTAADPFDILFYAAQLGSHEARFVEAAFRAHEVEAVQSAQATALSDDVIRAWRATGRPLAVVSNNSLSAVEAYLELHDLRTEITAVAARSSADVELLKPNPFLIFQAIERIAAIRARCALVGDSVTDIQASKAARVEAIGYANKPHKTIRLAQADADLIVTNMSCILAAIDGSQEKI